MESKVLYIAVESLGDPWDHPEILASIDNLCSNNFCLNKRADELPMLNSSPTLPPHSANLNHLSAAPLNDASSQPLFEEAQANSPTFPKRRLEGSTQFETGYRGSLTQPGSKFLEDMPSLKKPCLHKHPQKVWKPKRRHPKLVLGMDIGLPEACNLALCALVGRLAYKENCK